ncbi:MAG: UDP-3-O-(3-hydroxymyristoyl)glucosamine N-acyltransferase, partial [Candidatus Omnitrophica bacterium]|nr:UDP-3-O-(3-hydroxymyristoyl)glucosamine N-acyltransferase [Candidatus Omnitrophota bacterium]
MVPSARLIQQHQPVSPESHVTYTLQAIQSRVGGTVDGDPATRITGVNALELARPGELSFAEQEKLLPEVERTRAAAVIVPPSFPKIAGRTLLRVENPRLAFVKIIYLFQRSAVSAPGVHRNAVVSPEAQLGEGVTIAECAVIRPNARIGSGTVIESGVHIGEGVTIGEDCVVGPNVVIRYGCSIGDRVIIHGGTVIGADGFGYVWTEGRYLKIPQVGNVIIEDDVELGANVCVDRATFGSTIIKRGTKIDNLVQIAHNDVIGEHVTMSGQVGLAGSVTVGDHAAFGGKAGVVDHVKIGERAQVGAASVVTKSVAPGEVVWGYPARPIKEIKQE